MTWPFCHDTDVVSDVDVWHRDNWQAQEYCILYNKQEELDYDNKLL